MIYEAARVPIRFEILSIITVNAGSSVFSSCCSPSRRGSDSFCSSSSSFSLEKNVHGRTQYDELGRRSSTETTVVDVAHVYTPRSENPSRDLFSYTSRYFLSRVFSLADAKMLEDAMIITATTSLSQGGLFSRALRDY